MSAADPTQVAGYRVIKRIGRGGMSTVYLAEHIHLHRRVALKVLDPELAANPTFRTRFARESQIVAELEHPHIVPIFDAGESDGLLYLVMRYVENRDLRELLAEGEPLPHSQVRVLVEQLAGALGVAHDAGLVHRDIKPANVLFATDGHGDHFYLSDFGITKRAASGPNLTATGQVLGSVDFIAPEQIAGGPIDRRTDVYALGGLVYECLTGHVPFERDHELAVLLAHVREEPRPPSSIRPELTPAVDAALARALAKDPDSRPDTAQDFADELVAALATGSGPRPRPAPVGDPTGRPADTVPPRGTGPTVGPSAAEPGGDIEGAGDPATDTAADPDGAGPADHSGSGSETRQVPVAELPARLTPTGPPLSAGSEPAPAPAVSADAVTTSTALPPDVRPEAGTPPPAAAAPVRTQRSNERWWIVGLAVAAVVLILATIFVALAGRGASGSSGSAAGPLTTTPLATTPSTAAPYPTVDVTTEPTPDPAGAAEQSLREILPANATGCSRSAAGAATALSCVVGDAAVTYREYPGAAT